MNAELHIIEQEKTAGTFMSAIDYSQAHHVHLLCLLLTTADGGFRDERRASLDQVVGILTKAIVSCFPSATHSVSIGSKVSYWSSYILVT